MIQTIELQMAEHVLLQRQRRGGGGGGGGGGEREREKEVEKLRISMQICEVSNTKINIDNANKS